MSKAFIQKISSFAPTQISGCQLWLDGNDPLGTGVAPANGAGISKWVNKGLATTNLVLYTTNGGSNPTYAANFQNGLGSVAFNNNAFLSSFPFDLSTRTIFLVCVQNVAQFSGIMGLSAANNDSVSSTTGIAFQASEGAWYFSWLYNIFNGSNQIIYANSSPNTGYYLLTGTSAIATPLNIYEEVFSSNYEQTFVNGNAGQTFTTTTTPGSSTQIYVGARWNSTGSGQSLNGNILEVIIYNTALIPTQMKQVEGYLAQKWGRTSSLPAGHPGLTQTFYIKNPGIATTPSRAMTNLPYTNLFSPTSSSIGACQLWLDGADTAGTGTAPANGATVSTWVDKSGNGLNAVAVVAGTYSSAQKSITFSGTNYYNSSYTAAPTSETLFVVFNLTTNNGPFMIASPTCGGRVASTYTLTRFAGGTLCYSWGGVTTDTITTGVNTLGIVITDGTNNYASLNASLTLSGPGTVGYTGGTTTEIGGALGAQYLTNGYINEVIAYNSVLGTTQRQLVEGYLAWKWGLTSSLPSTHPFKSVPPGRPSQVAGIPVQVKMSAIRVVQLQYSGTYTTSGNFFATFTGNGSVTVLSPVTINYFAIGGGGGGGAGPGGGGGAGGLQMGSMSLSVGTYNIVIGPGGPAHTNGSNTTFGSTLVVALGGGFGADAYPSTETAGSGGCGGGRGSGNSVLGTGTQGYNGGNTAGAGSGGGGGVGGVGETSPNTSNVGGAGGIGVLYYGTYYGGGGGGAPNHGAGGGFAGAGGLGGGGRGGQNGPPTLEPVAGTPNTGGGGGGGRDANSYSGPGAAGGSGVFIISY
jgi:hypothetical protein